MIKIVFPKTCTLAMVFCFLSLGFTQEPTNTDIAGGRGGTSFADDQYPSDARIVEVQIFAENWVDALQVTYGLADGRTVTGAKHGGSGGRSNVFRLDSDEYITRISGRYGDYIDSLRIHTNKRTSPVFGGSGGEREFQLNVPARNQAIGFIGRCGRYLDAIGLISIPANFQQLTQSQIWGGRGGSPFADQDTPLGARISEIRIRAAKMVDGIQVVYTLQDGRTLEGNQHGGRGGNQAVFRLDSDEYIVGISGRYGDVLDSISFITNKRTSPRFGGSGGERDYRIDLPSGNMAIGFCGRSGEYLDAIGLVYTRTQSIRNLLRRLPGRNRSR